MMLVYRRQPVVTHTPGSRGVELNVLLKDADKENVPLNFVFDTAFMKIAKNLTCKNKGAFTVNTKITDTRLLGIFLEDT
jgi:hypothetical protein